MKKTKQSTALVVSMEQKVAQAEKDVEALGPLAVKLHAFAMTKPDDYETLMTDARMVRDIERRIVGDRDSATKKLQEELNNTKRTIKGWFAPMLVVCKNILELVDQKRLLYDRFLEEKQKKEQEILDAEAAAEQKRLERNAKKRAARAPTRARQKDILASVPEVEAEQAVVEVPQKIFGVPVAKVWDYEIVDADAVPEIVTGFTLWARRFDRADLLNARKALATSDQDQPIEGVRFFQKPSPRYGRL